MSIVALDREKAVSVPATQKFKTGTQCVIFFVHSRSLVPRLQIGRNANCHFERDNACRSLLVREDANGVRPRASRAPVLPGAFDPARCVAARSRARAPPSCPASAPRALLERLAPRARRRSRAPNRREKDPSLAAGKQQLARRRGEPRFRSPLTPLRAPPLVRERRRRTTPHKHPPSANVGALRGRTRTSFRVQ